MGTDLGRLGHRRHVRPGAGDAGGHRASVAGGPHTASGSRPAPRLSRYSVAHAQTRTSDPTVAGRWSALPAAEPDSTVRAHFQAELLLNRHGVLTKGAVAGEGVPGGFAMLYKVLTAFEDAGRCQRGYFVESLGGAQFAVASTVDRLRSYLDGVEPERREYHAVVLGRRRPRQPVWRRAAVAAESPTSATGPAARRARWWRSSTVSSRGSSNGAAASLLSFTDDAEAHSPRPARSPIWSVRVACSPCWSRRSMACRCWNRTPKAGGRPCHDALTSAGFARTPRGLRLR